MKFRNTIFIFIIAALIGAYVTKPTKEDFVQYIGQSQSLTAPIPVIDFKDRILYAEIEVTYINANLLLNNQGRKTATATKQQYIGIFKRFWKIGA